MFDLNESLEKIIIELEERNDLFPAFELDRFQNRLFLLGSGGYSNVYRMFDKRSRKLEYALKVIMPDEQKKTASRFRENVRLQKLLSEQSPYVTRIIDSKDLAVKLNESGSIEWVYNASEVQYSEKILHLQFILMESRSEIISKDKFGRVTINNQELETEPGVLNFAFQIAQALDVAHKNNVLHRDIKLENIFYDKKNNRYELGDFGSARLTENKTAETVIFTNGYKAPEITENDSYGVTADIYSFGITLYLLCNNLKFPGSNGYRAVTVQYLPGFVFPAPDNCSKTFTNVIRKMCRFDAAERYQSMGEVIAALQYVRDSLVSKDADVKMHVPDMETKTYSDPINIVKNVWKSRYERNRSKRIMDRGFNRLRFVFIAFFSLMLLFTQAALWKKTDFFINWQFWIVPFFVLLEAFFIQRKDMHIVFGVVCAGLLGYSIFSVGINVPDIVMILCLISWSPAIIAAGALSIIFWIILVLTQNCAWLNVFYKFDIGWILIILDIFALNRYYMLEVVCEKISERKADFLLDMHAVVFLLMAVAGIVLLGLEHLGKIGFPDAVTKLHLVRAGIICFLIWSVYNLILVLKEPEAYTEESGGE